MHALPTQTTRLDIHRRAMSALSGSQLACPGTDATNPMARRSSRLASRIVTSCNAVGAGTPEDPDKIPSVAFGSESETAPGQQPLDPKDQKTLSSSPWAKFKRFFGGDKLDQQKLKALGVGAVLSYGFVSNLTYGGGMAVAWIAFVKQKGLSPLMAGQWKVFLAFYAGFWTLQNFIRPLRFALAVSLAPVFDAIINFVQNTIGGSRQKAFAVSIVLLGATTLFLVFGSIFLFAGPMAYSTKMPAIQL